MARRQRRSRTSAGSSAESSRSSGGSRKRSRRQGEAPGARARGTGGAGSPERRRSGRGAAKSPPRLFPEEAILQNPDVLDDAGSVWRDAVRRAEAQWRETQRREEQALRSRRSALGEASREPGLDAAAMAALRAHVVNLVQGRFSPSGAFTSLPEDVDAIFGEHLPRWIADGGPEAGAPGGGRAPVRILLFAHGGLVPERTGLAIARRQVDWWLANGVYPVHFVWETGFVETLGQLIRAGRERAFAARDLADWTSDPVIEAIARTLGGRTVWGGMKRSAELAFDLQGGGRRVLQRLREAIERLRDRRVEIHLAGHSAGSIFHAHLVEAAADLGLPPVRTLTLLAPAITVEEFRRRVAPRLGREVERLTLFAMKRDVERDDTCGPYRKSLLYLIRNALEPESPTEVLGLEESLRRDVQLAALFGLAGAAASAGAEAIWSPTEDAAPASASAAVSHGGFDDDAPTMDSLLRRVLDRPQGEIVPFLEAARDMPGLGLSAAGEAIGAVADDLEVHGFDARALLAAPSYAGWDDGAEAPSFDADEPEEGAGPASSSPGDLSDDRRGDGAAGRRLALCVGIDRYAQWPLEGCVADATLWKRTLEALGFEVRPLLLDEQATRTGILEAMRSIVEAAEAGDVVVIQYAGHGTTVPDVNGDESGGDTPADDEAIVPFDFQRGAYLIDDDLATVFRAAKPGVNVTCFFDCCHSGTMNRLWPPTRSAEFDGEDVRARFMPLTPELAAAHVAYRQTLPDAGHEAARFAARGVHAASEIFFSACRSHESALESNGQGHFTAKATRLLGDATGRLTHAEFIDRLVEAFGPSRRQTPELHCADDLRDGVLLAPMDARGAAGKAGAAKASKSGPAPLSGRDRAAIATALEQIARRLR